MLAGLYAERTGDDATISELWPAIEAALAWIDGPGDPDGDGFVEYYRATEKGLANQGWKDSQDAIFHADGGLAKGPIALAEVQGYVYCAKRLAARCARRLGRTEQARRLRAQADKLAERFDESFWCPGARDLCDGARRQQGALPRSQLERRACPVHRYRQARAGGQDRRSAAAPAVFLRLGNSHHRQHRAAL